MGEHLRVQGVLTKQGTNIDEWINLSAEWEQCPVQGLLALLIAESNLSETAERNGIWPDWSVGLGQQTAAYARIGDQSPSEANKQLMRDHYFQPENAISEAARQFGHYYRQTGSVFEALAKYNAGPKAWWVNIPDGNRANYLRAWAQAAAYLEAPPMSNIDTHGWIFPVAGPCDYADLHWDGKRAVDLFCATNTPLVAVQDGTVVIADYPLGGHTAHLFTTDGFVVYYAHMVLRSGVAGPVVKGQQIGLADNTGNASTTPTHCHWAVGSAAYGIDNGGAGDVDCWSLLRAIEAHQAVDDQEDADMERISELEAQLAECENAGTAALKDIHKALGQIATAATFPQRAGAKAALTKARNALEHGAQPAAETAARGGLPREE